MLPLIFKKRCYFNVVEINLYNTTADFFKMNDINKKLTAFFISDGTGITVEMLGHSLIAQFDHVIPEKITMPFINNPEAAEEAVKRINETKVKDGHRPIILSTLVNPSIAGIIQGADALYLDCFQVYIRQIEKELDLSASTNTGRSHTVQNTGYSRRIDAVNYALLCDDGQGSRHLNNADVILVGVSRCGKTPTCLFLALQYGIRAANYPLIPEDFERQSLPDTLHTFKNKLFGLTILPDRLHRIRQERRPNSDYSSLENCKREVRSAEFLIEREKLPLIDTTTRSIEEVATVIRQMPTLKDKTIS